MPVKEAFFIEKPVATGGTVQGGVDSKHDFPAYRTADGRDLRWSAKFPLPEIDQRIYITMNGIGWAEVKGYFESEGSVGEGYLGVMTLAENPPKWLRERNKRDSVDMSKPEWYRAGIGCEFGAEIELTKEKN